MSRTPAAASPASRRRALSLRTIRAIMRREFIDVLRDRRSLLLTLLYPICMLIMYGYGIRYDVNNVPLTILDYDHTPESRDLTEQMLSSGYFELIRWAHSGADVDRDLMTDASRAAVVIPRQFAARIRAGEPVSVQAVIDGSDSNTATIAQGYLLAMMTRYSRTVAMRTPQSDQNPTPSTLPIELKSRIWYNPELKSVNFVVPGMIAVIMMIVGAVMTALSIVKEKERGTIEQILVSPILPLELMIGKIVPYMLIAFINLMIIVTAGYVIFQVPIKGSLVQLTILSLLYLASSLGIGVFVSTIADTMQSAMMAAFFMSLLPSILLSGFIFPIENMPIVVRLLTYLVPGRYFVTAIRGVYLKGIGLSLLWPEALMLLCFSIAIVWLSANRFQEKLG
jgi:ABC-2 type transport system permease protein